MKRKIECDDGSMTVEASIVLPVFLIGILMFVYVMKSYYIYNNMNIALYSIAGEMASMPSIGYEINDKYIKDKLIDNIGKDLIKKMDIKYGINGVDVSNSFFDSQKDILHINNQYEINLPILGSNITNYKIGNNIVVRIFNGDRRIATNKKFVYITKTGRVYHTDIECSYLGIKKSRVQRHEIDNYRNDSGAKYYVCKECDDEKKDKYVYITKYGTSYHNIMTCCAITRIIRAIDIHEIDGRKKCEKCCGR